MTLCGALIALVTCMLVDLPRGSQSQDDSEQLSPSVGDIRLVSEEQDAYRVQVYLPAGGGNGLQLGEICLEGRGDAASIGTVICRQYGYESGILSAGLLLPSGAGSDDATVWLHNMDCGDPPPNSYHILRCKYVLSYTRCSPAYVMCEGDKLTTNPYQGQVSLCPPLDFPQDQSISTGLVMIYLHSSWGTINFNTSVGTGSNERDTLCRQLGFTRSRFHVGLDYEHCIDGAFLPRPIGVWLTADEFTCEESKACSGCCYKYPTSTVDLPLEGDNLVLSCIFDPETESQLTEGTESLCSFGGIEDGKQLMSPACTIQKDRTVAIVGGTIGAVLLITCIVALCCLCCFVRERKRIPRNDRQPLLPHLAQFPRCPCCRQPDDVGN